MRRTFLLLCALVLLTCILCSAKDVKIHGFVTSVIRTARPSVTLDHSGSKAIQPSVGTFLQGFLNELKCAVRSVACARSGNQPSKCDCTQDKCRTRRSSGVSLFAAVP
jgi:hypothetical protein